MIRSHEYKIIGMSVAWISEDRLCELLGKLLRAFAKLLTS